MLCYTFMLHGSYHTHVWRGALELPIHNEGYAMHLEEVLQVGNVF